MAFCSFFASKSVSDLSRAARVELLPNRWHPRPKGSVGLEPARSGRGREGPGNGAAQWKALVVPVPSRRLLRHTLPFRTLLRLGLEVGTVGTRHRFGIRSAPKRCSDANPNFEAGWRRLLDGPVALHWRTWEVTRRHPPER